MQAPRASACSRMAGPTMTQPAAEASSWARYLGLDRKLRCAGPACSSGASASTTMESSPCSSPPSACTISASRSAIALAQGVQGSDHLVGDVVLGIDVDRFLQDQVVLLLLGDLLHHAVGAVQHLLQFLVLARVQVFLEFAALALEFAVLVDQRLLALAALGLGQRRRLD